VAVSIACRTGAPAGSGDTARPASRQYDIQGREVKHLPVFTGLQIA